ncbi:12722_t:CDS:2 [Racocetra persica]|uniref:12722_t:CDS:1 n=1 Tax=Racocetra persica TaxID=160502 RepID=A0ACA9LBY2_9GLOM|nr:12722_t:CDS:2 [Racocetra persica]
MSQRRKGCHPGGKRQKQPKPCLFIVLPPEMFINVCQYLPPKDLLSLARVCKRFNGYLSAETSTTTQEIWRASRTAYLPHLQMSPPEGMTERQYVKLVLERGCQFCDRSKIRKVYWEFFVRSCEDCLRERISRKEDLLPEYMDDGRLSDDVIAGLTYIPSWVRRSYTYMRNSRMCPSSLYWTDHVLKTVQEYQSLPIYPQHIRNDWIKQKKEEGLAKMKEVNQRRLDYDRGIRELVHQNSLKKNERTRLIKSKIQAMKSEKNANNCLKYDNFILEQCPTYNNHMFMQIRQSPQPFTERSWVLLKKKLLKEYEERRISKRQERQNKEKAWGRDVVFQMRQYDIYQLAKNWLPDSSLENTVDIVPAVDSAVNSTSSNMDIDVQVSSTVTSDNSATLISNILNSDLSDLSQYTLDSTNKSETETITDVNTMNISNTGTDILSMSIMNLINTDLDSSNDVNINNINDVNTNDVNTNDTNDVNTNDTNDVDNNDVSTNDVSTNVVNTNINVVDLTVETETNVEKEVIDLTDESETNITVAEKSETSQDFMSTEDDIIDITNEKNIIDLTNESETSSYGDVKPIYFGVNSDINSINSTNSANSANSANSTNSISPYNPSLITLPPISLLSASPIQPLDLSYITLPNLYSQPINDYGLPFSFPSNDTTFQFDWNEWIMEDQFSSYMDNSYDNMQSLLIDKYLPWCPSFRNPPFHDDNPYNLWDDDFLMNTLMPKIWNEAKELHKKSNDVNLTTVQGAVLSGYREHNIFKCKFCKLMGENYGEYSYLDVRTHLHLGHGVYHIDDEEMIEVCLNYTKGSCLDIYNDPKSYLFSIGYNFKRLNDLVKF